MTISKKDIQKIEEILKDYKKEDTKEIKNSLAKKLINLYLESNLKTSSKANKISLTKKYVSNKINDLDFTNKIVAPKTITEETFKKAAHKRMNKKIFEIKKSTLDKIISFKNSENIYEMLIFLLFATGRRFKTILNNDIRNKKKTSFIEAKLLKKRGEAIDKYYCFPVIGRKNEVLKVLKKFRKKFKNMNIKQYSLNRRANIFIKKHLEDENINLRLLRSLYALYLFKFKNKKRQTINAFVGTVLCHESDQCGIYYTGLEILDPKK
jgi:hypothetical protein